MKTRYRTAYGVFTIFVLLLCPLLTIRMLDDVRSERWEEAVRDAESKGISFSDRPGPSLEANAASSYVASLDSLSKTSFNRDAPAILQNIWNSSSRADQMLRSFDVNYALEINQVARAATSSTHCSFAAINQSDRLAESSSFRNLGLALLARAIIYANDKRFEEALVQVKNASTFAEHMQTQGCYVMWIMGMRIKTLCAQALLLLALRNDTHAYKMACLEALDEVERSVPVRNVLAFDIPHQIRSLRQSTMSEGWPLRPFIQFTVHDVSIAWLRHWTNAFQELPNNNSPEILQRVLTRYSDGVESDPVFEMAGFRPHVKTYVDAFRIIIYLRDTTNLAKIVMTNPSGAICPGLHYRKDVSGVTWVYTFGPDGVDNLCDLKQGQYWYDTRDIGLRLN